MGLNCRIGLEAFEGLYMGVSWPGQLKRDCISVFSGVVQAGLRSNVRRALNQVESAITGKRNTVV